MTTKELVIMERSRADAAEMERDALAAQVAELRRALEKIVPPGEDWWCPSCQVALSGTRVTFEERCDTCGTFLGYQSAEWIAEARAALAISPGEALERVKREAKAEALEELCNTTAEDDIEYRNWLRKRAAKLRKETE